MDCYWQITSDSLVKIEVLDIDLQDYADALKFYDGDSQYFGMLGTLSSSSTFNTVSSTGAHMFITFTTDDNIEARGFQLRYKSTEPTNTLVVVGSCGGVLIFLGLLSVTMCW